MKPGILKKITYSLLGVIITLFGGQWFFFRAHAFAYRLVIVFLVVILISNFITRALLIYLRRNDGR